MWEGKRREGFFFSPLSSATSLSIVDAVRRELSYWMDADDTQLVEFGINLLNSDWSTQNETMALAAKGLSSREWRANSAIQLTISPSFVRKRYSLKQSRFRCFFFFINSQFSDRSKC